MIRFISSLLLILGNAVAQFRDPITLRPTIGPLITPNTIAPVRTIVPIRTIVPSRSTTIISTFDTSNVTTDFSSTLSTTSIFSNNIDNQEDDGFNMELIYILVPTLGSIFVLFIIYSLRKKRNINNVVKIDLNIENRIDDSNEVENNNNESNQPINRLPSNNSESISNHIYEEVDYEARYEMPSLANVNYENIAKESDYGRQVTTIV